MDFTYNIIVCYITLGVIFFYITEIGIAVAIQFHRFLPVFEISNKVVNCHLYYKITWNIFLNLFSEV